MCVLLYIIRLTYLGKMTVPDACSEERKTSTMLYII